MRCKHFHHREQLADLLAFGLYVSRSWFSAAKPQLQEGRQ